MHKKIMVGLLLACVVCFAGSAFAGEWSADVGVFSRYVNAFGKTVGDKEPVVQASGTYKLNNGLYGNVWVSQSTEEPGFAHTYTNEIDVTAGYGGKIGEHITYDLHAAYFNIMNGHDLVEGTNGDLTNAGGTLRYFVSPKTSVFGNVELYHGLGSRGFSNGLREGGGVRTTAFDPVTVDASAYHVDFLGQHGNYLRLALESTHPIFTIASGEVRPLLIGYKPIGKYENNHDNIVVVGIHITW